MEANKKKVLIFSDFPTRNDPVRFTFIKSRIDSIKDLYDITVVKIEYSNKNAIKIEYNQGYNLFVIHLKKLSIPKFRMLIYSIKVHRYLKKIVNKINPDLIHVHFSSNYSWVINIISKKEKIPYIITEHASTFEQAMNKKYLGRLLTKSLKEANELITVSPYLKDTMQKFIDREIRIIPNIVDIKKFNFNPSPKVKKTSEVNAISVGRFDKEDIKGYEMLVLAVAKVIIDFPHFKLNIVGDGPNKIKIYDIIKKNMLEKNIKLLGKIENSKLTKFYNESDFFISSSKVETFGVAIIEAMSCGLPVVSTRSGGPESYINNMNGILVKNNDVDELYKGICKMIRRYEQYNPIIIRNIILDNFSYRSYRKQKHILYNKVANNE